jgi:hypothetical protein
MLLSEGQMSDHKSAAASLNVRPTAEEWVEDRGSDSDGFRAALVARGITPIYPATQKPKGPASVLQGALSTCVGDKVKNMFARLVDWPRIAMRYRPCVHFFMSPVVIAAMVIFWIK